MVFARDKAGARFAFLVKDSGESCRFVDVVVLPCAAQANALLQCPYGDLSERSSGLGMRKAGVKIP
jgi:hypothetical protein